MNAQQIIKHQQEAKACKRSRKLHCTYCTMDVQLDGMHVRLFFCKRGNGKWNGLLTTDMSLAFLEAYRLYEEVTKDNLELSVADKIWVAIVDILLDIAERYSIEETLLLTDYINRNHTGQMLKKLRPYALVKLQ